jgi:carboxyl-terminal processing protease
MTNPHTATYRFILFLGVLMVSASLAEEQKPDPQPTQELRLFTEVYSRMKSDYVEPLDDKTLIRQCVQGMVSGVDPHSAYLDETEFREISSTGRPRGGIGLELTMDGVYASVVSSIEDTPAWKAGLRTGDVIYRIDGADVKGKTLTEVVKLLRGEPNTRVTLTVARADHKLPLTFTVTRAEIRIQSVKSSLTGDGFGYVRITQFQANTGKLFKEAIKGLAEKNKGPLKGLVLDLRSNPGGLLNSAIEVADGLLDRGLIVYTEGRTSGVEMKFTATPPDLLQGAPVVVLVDAGTAAGTEVIAGALQDHKRARILGNRTFGRASIQTIIPLANGGALKLTTARWRTPNGHLIQGTGIKPDIELAKSESIPDSRTPMTAQDLTASQAFRELRRMAGIE